MTFRDRSQRSQRTMARYHAPLIFTSTMTEPFALARLMVRLQEEPTIQGFSNNCLVPYLYAMSLRLSTGHEFIFGELRHGLRGEFDDCKELLGLERDEQVLPALRSVFKKKRVANKNPCPCGCRQRLGKCKFNAVVRRLRDVLIGNQ